MPNAEGVARQVRKGEDTMANIQAKAMLLIGAIFLVVGVVLSIRSNLLGTVQHGLNGATENAVIFDLIGVVCLIAGWGLRR